MLRRTLTVLTSLALVAPGASALTIDPYSDVPVNAVTTTAIAADVSAQHAVAAILGGERDVNVTRTSGGAAGETTATFGNGTFDYLETSADRDGTFLIDYDGGDGMASLDPIGLGGIDLTSGGLDDAFFVPVASSNESLMLNLTARTDAANFSTFSVAVPVTSGLGVVVPFVDFVPGGGTGVDFTNLGSLSVELVNANTATDLSLGGALGAFRTIPEPGTGVLIALGLTAIGWTGRRR